MRLRKAQIVWCQETNTMSNQEFHLVLGAGQIGPLVAERLVAKGHRVRIARRTAAPTGIAGVENISLDVRDADAVARAAEGATTVYNCVNPLYFQWNELLLPMTRGIVDGTAKAAARLVALDCLYMYGDTTLMNERTPMAPVSKKGALRVKSAQYMLEANARGALSVSIGRAADFIGPRAPQSMFGDRFFERVFANKSVEVFGDVDQLHSYSYTADVADGLVALGARSNAGGIWMLPVQPAESTRMLVDRFSRALGRPIKTIQIPNFVFRAIGVFDPVMRELAEMTYQWKQPYVVDDAKFRATFGLVATPWDESIGETAAWARATWEKRAAA
jgi:nucleoside-diphosphate-sugar epimerase